jgi:hypothetical protein
MDHRQSIHRSSSVQSNPVQHRRGTACMAERSYRTPYDPPTADLGQETTPAKFSILNWAQHQFERCTIYDNQGPIEISI